MVSHAVWKTWPSGLSNDKNLGLRPRFLSTESLGPCFSHSMGDHAQIPQQIKRHLRIHFNSWILMSTLGPVSCDFPWYRTCKTHIGNPPIPNLSFFVSRPRNWYMYIISQNGHFVQVNFQGPAIGMSDVSDVFRQHCHVTPKFYIADPDFGCGSGIQLGLNLVTIETVSPEGTFCDTVQVPSSAGDMELN